MVTAFGAALRQTTARRRSGHRPFPRRRRHRAVARPRGSPVPTLGRHRPTTGTPRRQRYCSTAAVHCHRRPRTRARRRRPGGGCTYPPTTADPEHRGPAPLRCRQRPRQKRGGRRQPLVRSLDVVVGLGGTDESAGYVLGPSPRGGGAASSLHSASTETDGGRARAEATAAGTPFARGRCAPLARGKQVFERATARR